MTGQFAQHRRSSIRCGYYVYNANERSNDDDGGVKSDTINDFKITIILVSTNTRARARIRSNANAKVFVFQLVFVFVSMVTRSRSSGVVCTDLSL